MKFFLLAGGVLQTVLLGVTLLGLLWSIGSFYYNISGMSSVWSMVFALLLAALWGCSFKYRWLLWVLAAVELAVLVNFLLVDAGKSFKNTIWQKPWGRNPRVIFSGRKIKIINVRDFLYRTCDDYTVRYRDIEYDLDKLAGVDIALSHWDGLQSVAHTMLSFVFRDGENLAVSVETRLPEGAEQGVIPGLYKQYGLLVILGTENDLFKLRTDYRKEELYLYRTRATVRQAEDILLPLLEGVNKLAEEPEFYNSITRNCTTSMAPLLRIINPGFTSDIRLLFNGFSDRLLFDLGYLARRENESFSSLKKRRKVNGYVDKHPEYSRAIRIDI